MRRDTSILTVASIGASATEHILEGAEDAVSACRRLRRKIPVGTQASLPGRIGCHRLGLSLFEVISPLWQE